MILDKITNMHCVREKIRMTYRYPSYLSQNALRVRGDAISNARINMDKSGCPRKAGQGSVMFVIESKARSRSGKCCKKV